MKGFSRFGRFFVPIGGVGSLFQMTTMTTAASNNPASREYVTGADIGHPHLTTQKTHVQDKMESNPKVLNSPFEWPRVNTIDEDSHREISAHEASLLQQQMTHDFVSTHQHDQVKPLLTTDSNNNNNTTQKMTNAIPVAADEAAITTEPVIEKKAVIVEPPTVKKLENSGFVQGSETTSTSIQVSEYIDHTALKAFVSKEDITTLCNEAIKHNFAAVCVNPVWVEYCSNLLKNSNVKVCTVIGFPLGANSTKIKVLEAIQAVQDGASEVDMVISVGRIKTGEWDLVELEIRSVVEAVEGSMLLETHDSNSDKYDNLKNNDNNKVIVKVILETSMLTKEEIVKACEICVRSGADFVKTSTGFGGGGATIENVKLMKQTVIKELSKLNKNESECKVKASGGVRNYQSAKEMIKAGASRIGTSSGINIVKGDTTNSSQTQASGY